MIIHSYYTYNHSTVCQFVYEMKTLLLLLVKGCDIMVLFDQMNLILDACDFILMYYLNILNSVLLSSSWVASLDTYFYLMLLFHVSIYMVTLWS